MKMRRPLVAIVQLQRETSVVVVPLQRALGLVVLAPDRRRPPIVLSLHPFPFHLPNTSSHLSNRLNHKYLSAPRRVLINNTPKFLSRPSMARHQLEDMLMLSITGIMDLVVVKVQQTLECTVATWACRLQITRMLVAPVRAVNRWAV